MAAFTESSFLVSLAVLIIVAGQVAFLVIRYLYQNRKPNFVFSVIKNPFVWKGDPDQREKRETVLNIPARKRIIVYFAINVRDWKIKRYYIKSHAWIKFKDEIFVDHATDYSTLEWGKHAVPRTKHQIGYDVETPLIDKKDLDGVYFPAIINTEKLQGDYPVHCQFWTESIKSGSVEHTVTLRVVDRNFSHEEKFFNPDTFKVK